MASHTVYVTTTDGGLAASTPVATQGPRACRRPARPLASSDFRMDLSGGGERRRVCRECLESRRLRRRRKHRMLGQPEGVLTAVAVTQHRRDRPGRPDRRERLPLRVFVRRRFTRRLHAPRPADPSPRPDRPAWSLARIPRHGEDSSPRDRHGRGRPDRLHDPLPASRRASCSAPTSRWSSCPIPGDRP